VSYLSDEGAGAEPSVRRHPRHNQLVLSRTP